MAEIKKKVKFHPLDPNTGEVIENQTLHPETDTENVIDQKSGKRLSTKLNIIDQEIEDLEAKIKTGQSDWAEDDPEAPGFIKNKPTNVSDFNNDANYQTATDVENAVAAALTPYYDKTEVNELLEAKADVDSVYTKTEVDTTLENYIEKSETPGFVKNDGSIDTNTYVVEDSLATVATTGDYEDLTNKPVIPAAQVQSDWGQTVTTEVDYIKNKPTLATVATSGNYDDLSNKPALATVATSGSYTDLSDKPDIPQVSIANNQITVNGITLTYGTSGNEVLVQTDASGKLATSILPDAILGQMIYGGTVDFEDSEHLGYPYAELSENAKTKLGILDDNLVLLNTATDPTKGGYQDNENIYYICKNNGRFADIDYAVGDWILATNKSWSKIANTDAVVSVNGKVGEVVLTKSDVGLGNVENKSSAEIRSEITASDIETALHYTPYSSENPAGYITANGVVYSVNGATPDAQGAVSITIPTVPITEIQVNTVTITPDHGVVNIEIPAQVQANWDETVTTAPSYIQNKPILATVATTGDFNDLSNKPDAVVANTTITPSITLTNLQVGEAVYEIPQGAVYTAGTGITINESNTVSLDTDFLSSCIGYEEVVE